MREWGVRDDATGQYVRTVEVWTPERWDDARVNNRGRAMVYRPDYPRAYESGYELRTHVVWWLETGEPVPPGMNLHHLNGVKTDDRFENLALMDHGEHSRLHNLQSHQFTCHGCGQEFTKTGSAVAKRRAEGKVPKFCSAACYYAHPRTAEHRERQSAGLRLAYAEGRRGKRG